VCLILFQYVKHNPKMTGLGFYLNNQFSAFYCSPQAVFNSSNFYKPDVQSKIGHNGEERYQSGHLLSPTLIEEGRLVSE